MANENKGNVSYVNPPSLEPPRGLLTCGRCTRKATDLHSGAGSSECSGHRDRRKRH